MLVKSLSIELVSRFSIICTIAIALLLLGPNPAKAESRSQAVDRLTDVLFYRVNPLLNNRRLQAGDDRYIRQWLKLREAIDPRVKSVQEVCFRVSPQEKGWEFTTINGETYEQTYDRLADVIFYSRHPELTGQRILESDKLRFREWSAIRYFMHLSNCGL